MWKLIATGLATVLSAVVVEVAVSQTVFSKVLNELTEYYGAAATFIGGAVLGVDKLEPAGIPKADREDVRIELNRISLEISNLQVIQAPFAFELSDYIDQVRAGKLNGKRRENAWKAILSKAEKVKTMVGGIRDLVASSRWIRVVNVKQTLALREVLQSRDLVLQKIESTPAPAATSEIDEIERLSRFYRQLRASLGDLNSALARAADRLKSD